MLKSIINTSYLYVLHNCWWLIKLHRDIVIENTWWVLASDWYNATSSIVVIQRPIYKNPRTSQTFYYLLHSLSLIIFRYWKEVGHLGIGHALSCFKAAICEETIKFTYMLCIDTCCSISLFFIHSPGIPCICHFTLWLMGSMCSNLI